MRSAYVTGRLIMAVTLLLGLAAAPAPGDDVEPVSLRDWTGGWPAFVTDDYRFELTKVVSSFSSHHGPHTDYPVPGAILRVEGWVSPPEPRTVLSNFGTIELDELTDVFGRDLLPGTTVPDSPNRVPHFMRNHNVRRPGFQVYAEWMHLREVPAGLATLRGRACFEAAEHVETVTAPLEITRDLVEVHPGLLLRVTAIDRNPGTRRVRVMIDYALQNAPNDYDRAAPPFLLDGRLLGADGQPGRSRSWNANAGRTVLLHTGKHGTIRAEAMAESDEEMPAAVEIELITAVRAVEIPFHVTDLDLARSMPAERAGDRPAYEADGIPGKRVVEQDDVVLSLSRVTSRHEIGMHREAVKATVLSGDLNVRLPAGVWSHRGMPRITSLVDHRGEVIEFEQTMMPRQTASPFRAVDRYEDIRGAFTCRHELPPVDGLSHLIGEMTLYRASEIETVELPWGAMDAQEVVPGVTIAIDEVESKATARTLVLEISRVRGDEPRDVPALPSMRRMTFVDADGAELRTQENYLRADQLAGRDVQLRRLTAMVEGDDASEPAAVRFDVIVALEEVVIEFDFEDLPFRVNR